MKKPDFSVQGSSLTWAITVCMSSAFNCNLDTAKQFYLYVTNI